MKSDTFLAAYRKKCHCEPVTDVTGVAIRIQMGNLSYCAQILPDCSIPPRGDGVALSCSGKKVPKEAVPGEALTAAAPASEPPSPGYPSRRALGVEGGVFRSLP